MKPQTESFTQFINAIHTPAEFAKAVAQVIVHDVLAPLSVIGRAVNSVVPYPWSLLLAVPFMVGLVAVLRRLSKRGRPWMFGAVAFFGSDVVELYAAVVIYAADAQEPSWLVLLKVAFSVVVLSLWWTALAKRVNAKDHAGESNICGDSGAF